MPNLERLRSYRNMIAGTLLLMFSIALLLFCRNFLKDYMLIIIIDLLATAGLALIIFTCDYRDFSIFLGRIPNINLFVAHIFVGSLIVFLSFILMVVFGTNNNLPHHEVKVEWARYAISLFYTVAILIIFADLTKKLLWSLGNGGSSYDYTDSNSIDDMRNWMEED